MALVPVILSGGMGTRLWPLSRGGLPKQLQRIIGTETMLQETARRLEGLGAAAPVVVCNRRHAAVIRGQLAAVGATAGMVVCEPVGRNTAPAVAAAAALLGPEDVLLVLPADHVVRDLDAFRAAVAAGVEAARSGNLVTFGIVPTRPETGYGYIRAAGSGLVRPVERFVEKPDAATAAEYLAGGDHLWNSGMFVFPVALLREELARHAPAVAAAVEEAVAVATRSGDEVLLGESFAHAPATPIDVAVMERTGRAVVVALDAGWSDVGSWAAVWELVEGDEGGNVVVGDVVAYGVEGSYLRAGGRLLAVVGLEGVVVVDTGDAVLVTTLDRAQDVKAVVDRLRAEGRIEVEEPPPTPG